MTLTSPWFRELKRAPERPGALFVLLPHAGGAAHAFVPWVPALPPSAAAFSIEYPGHASRLREPLCRNWDELVDQLVHELGGKLEETEVPVILGGHSLGALLSYDVARRLEGLDNGVSALFLSAAVPPHRQASYLDLAMLTEWELAAELGSRGDIPAEIVTDREAMDLYLPIVRADIELISGFSRDEPWPRVAHGALVVGGDNDKRVAVSELGYWADLIGGRTRVAVLEGGHFYQRHRMAELAPLLAELVQSVAGSKPSREEEK